MFVAMPSSDADNSLNVPRPLNITSRTIRSDHLSPAISSAMLIGQPDRRALRELPFMTRTLAYGLRFASDTCYDLQYTSYLGVSPTREGGRTA